MQRRNALALALVIGMLACGSDGTTEPPIEENGVEITADRDNTLYEDPLGQLSNGAGQFLFVGTTNQPRLRRALLHFDVAGSAISAGSTVDSVRLTLHLSRTNAGPTTVRLHRVTAAWGEGASDAGGPEGPGALATQGDATWTHAFFDTTPWTNVGGDFVTTPSGSAVIQTAGPYTWTSTATMVSDVQGWLDSPAGNFGWVLIGDESGPLTAKRFDSRENAVSANRPRLTIFHTP